MWIAMTGCLHWKRLLRSSWSHRAQCGAWWRGAVCHTFGLAAVCYGSCVATCSGGFRQGRRPEDVEAAEEHGSTEGPGRLLLPEEVPRAGRMGGARHRSLRSEGQAAEASEAGADAAGRSHRRARSAALAKAIRCDGQERETAGDGGLTGAEVRRAVLRGGLAAAADPGGPPVLPSVAREARHLRAHRRGTH